MKPQKLRPTFKDCLHLTGAIIRDTAGLARQCATVAGTETTAAVGRKLSRASASLEHVRWAVSERFNYTAPETPKPADAATFIKV